MCEYAVPEPEARTGEAPASPEGAQATATEAVEAQEPTVAFLATLARRESSCLITEFSTPPLDTMLNVILAANRILVLHPRR